MATVAGRLPHDEVQRQLLRCLAIVAAYPVDEVALKLSELLSMPVKVVESGSTMRCLEMRLSFADARRPRCVLAFRTDADRQGESGDVASWPQPDDPRTPMLLGSLLSGLAAKLRFYCHPAVVGFTATIRMMNQFVASRGYPRSWWMHAFAIALLRNGVPFPCLTRSMRKMLIAHKGIAETTHALLPFFLENGENHKLVI